MAPAALLSVVAGLWASAPGAAARPLTVRHQQLVLTAQQQLSNETTYTTLGTAGWAAAVRSAPSTTASLVAHLIYFTPDQQAVQTYIELQSAVVAGRSWVQIRVPGRPNGRTGWVLAGALDPAGVSHSEIVVNLQTYWMYVYRNGSRVLSLRVGVGNVKRHTTTPPGHFWITESFPSSDPFYGPWAFGTSDYATDTEFPDSSVVGIHGTNAPGAIPGDPSHGCVRLRDADVLKLKRYVGIGTPVWIQ